MALHTNILEQISLKIIMNHNNYDLMIDLS